MTAFRAILPYKTYRFLGDDALAFLQGQLTQDVSKITEYNCHYGAYCDAKGRMFANFLIQADATGYRLRLPSATADNVIKRLQLFVLRAKVTIEALSLEHFGLNKSAAMQFCEMAKLTLPETFGCIQGNDFTLSALPHDYYELSLTADSPAQAWLASIVENSEAIETLRLSGGHFNILPETTEKLLPQQTPLESWGAINYQKGCYVGQEIIARNKYRGKVKKAMGFALVPTTDDITLLSSISKDNKAVGQVIEVHKAANATICLAILALDSFGTPVHLAETQTTFTLIN